MICDSHGYIRRTKHGTFVRKKEEIARQGNFLASLELAKTRKITYEHLLADVEYRLSIQID